jgi:hypothetical protein
MKPFWTTINSDFAALTGRPAVNAMRRSRLISRLKLILRIWRPLSAGEVIAIDNDNLATDEANPHGRRRDRLRNQRENAAAQYSHVVPLEHVHPLVRTEKQLDRVLNERRSAKS